MVVLVEMQIQLVDEELEVNEVTDEVDFICLAYDELVVEVEVLVELEQQLQTELVVMVELVLQTL